MAKTKEQKSEPAANKKFEQALAALNPGENLEIARPPEKRGARPWVVAALAIVIVVVGAWSVAFPRTQSLADRLPEATSFYFFLALPREPRWFDRIFFWRQVEIPSANLNRLYSKLDFISWPGVDFQKQILPLLKNKIEFGRLDNGTLILKTELTDKGEWLSITKAADSANNYGDELIYDDEAGTYQGEIIQPGEQAETEFSTGLWPGLTKNPNKISWLVKNSELYISDQPDWRNYLSQKRSLPKFERGMIQAFIKDKGALSGLDSLWGQFFAPDKGYPLKVIARNINQNLVWQAGTLETKFSWDEVGSLEPSFDSALLVTGRNIGQAYAQWQSVLGQLEQSQLTKNINELESIIKEFYGLDLALVLEKIEKRELVLRLSGNSGNQELAFGNDWSLQIKDQENKIDEELLGYLQKFGSSLFAITHPQAVEHKLSDGSKMIELRAGSEGLIWQPLEWSSQGRQHSFYSLRGQGETNGYFIGFIPAKGYWLASSLSLISQTLEAEDNSPRPTKCALPFNPDLRLVFSPALVSMTLAAAFDGRLAGCVQFLD